MWRAGSRRGREDPCSENCGERATPGSRGAFFAPPEVTGGGGAIPNGGSGVRAQAGAEISSTITAPVMKGLRGGDFERRVSGGGEEDVHRTAFIIPVIFAVLPGTATFGH